METGTIERERLCRRIGSAERVAWVVAPAGYDKVREDDVVALDGLVGLAPGSTVTLVLSHTDGTVDRVALKHTFNAEQIGWFEAGSALNVIRSNLAAG